MKRAAIVLAGLLMGASCDDAFAQCMRICGQRGVAEYSYPAPPAGCDVRPRPGVCRCGDAKSDGGQC